MPSDHSPERSASPAQDRDTGERAASHFDARADRRGGMDTPEPFWMKYMGAGLALSILLHLVAGYLLVHGIEA